MKNSTKLLALVPLIILALALYALKNQETAELVEEQEQVILYDDQGQPYVYGEQKTEEAPLQQEDQEVIEEEVEPDLEQDLEMIEEIPEAEIDLQDEQGMTPLLRAIDQDQPKHAIELLKRGANPNITDKNGTHPFVAAVVMGEPALIEILLQKDIDPNMPMDLIGTTPLMIASMENQKELVELLVEAGALIDQQNQEGRSALMMAADMGNTSIVEYFLERQADRSLKDSKGLSAYDLAQKRGLLELANSLKL